MMRNFSVVKPRSDLVLKMEILTQVLLHLVISVFLKGGDSTEKGAQHQYWTTSETTGFGCMSKLSLSEFISHLDKP